MNFSIITPSYNNGEWLKLCIASVGDQSGVSVEHIIQDAGSKDGTLDWLPGHPGVQAFIEKDKGMYDAINRGFLRGTGEVFAWLNCDEQYLPGTLAKVARFFEEHPEVDVLFGDAVLLDPRGDVLSLRQAMVPSLWHTQLAHLATLSCATFVRRSVIQRGLLLDCNFKAISDAVWVVSMLKAKLKMAVLNEPLSTFTLTGTNLGQSKLAFQEAMLWRNQVPGAAFLRQLAIVYHRLRKWRAGAYTPRDITVSVYTPDSPDRRVEKSRTQTPTRWPSLAEVREG